MGGKLLYAIALGRGQRTRWSQFSPPTMWDPEIGSESSEGGWCDKRGTGGSDDGKYRGLLTTRETKRTE